MNSKARTLAASAGIAAAAMAGLLNGCRQQSNSSAGTAMSSADPAKHVCAGRNVCKGTGGCMTNAHTCKGQNLCKGQGGCSGARQPTAEATAAPPAEDAFPKFPWPPPQPSGVYVLPDSLMAPQPTSRPSLGQVASQVGAALSSAGYIQVGYYSVPDGFAMATQLEQIDRDGLALAPPSRWAGDTMPPVQFSLSEYLRQLFTARAGYYRIVVFVVTDKVFGTAPAVAEPAAQQWTTHGAHWLPQAVSDAIFTSAHHCCACIYEFERADADHSPEFVPSGRLTAKDHLQKSKILSAIGGQP